ncbi:MAG TPA: condensation domain-containing protein, partial [Thermoanaerobaculia bacterium]|nr:condensation domain-containing protein [Thermoanaerobaculia bacterium]
IDHQVKIRGFRIELGEIEAVLATHPDVREAVAAVRDGHLAAWVVPNPESKIQNPKSLADWLRDKLPPYMIPAAFVSLSALPLSPNGKVDRKALPDPEREGGGPHTEPRTERERLIAQVWAEVLGLPRVGLHDSFFELGGQSLLATRVVSRLRGVLGVELPVRRLFEAPTVAELARLAEQADGAPAPPLFPRPAAARAGDPPLSFAQQRLWLLDQLEPGAAYNMPTAIRLTGGLPEGLLERIFTEVVRRHETLRTTFPAREGKPVQAVAPGAARLEIPVVDLSHLPPAEREERARGIAAEEARRPFDLRTGPLLRLTLVRLGERERLLLITLHHIVADAWSLGVLLREIAALYEAFSQGRPSPLPEPPVQYADFAVWQRGWLQGEILEAQIAHWKDRLAGAPQVLALPADRPRPAVPTHHGGLRRVALPASLSAAVLGLCRRYGATPFMTLVAAWAVLLARHAGQEEVLVGTPVAGRNRREVEDLIGLFINTLVLRADLRGGPGFHEMLAKVREASLDAFSHQDLPFERLVGEIAVDRDLRSSPVFQALFILQNAPMGPLELPGLTLRPDFTWSGTAKLDLTLSLEETAGGFSGFLEYDADLFDPATAERLAARYERLLAAVAAAPEAPVRDLPLMPEAERHQVLLEPNDASAAYPADTCVHELVAAQAARTPGAVAVSGAGGSLRYGELDDLSSRLARRLVSVGVGPEDLVGVCAGRSP